MYIRTRPWENVHNLQNDLNRIFNRFGAEKEDIECRGDWIPSVDICETSEVYKIYAELPGVNKDEIKITVKENVLQISGEKKQQEQSEKENLYRNERVFGSFCRQFSLPNQVDADNIKAAFKDGVLFLTVPKREQAKAKEIKIQTK